MNKLFYSFLCALIVALPLSAPSVAKAMADRMDHSLVKVNSIQAPSDLGNIELYRDNDGFSIKQDGYTHQVPHYNVDKSLKQIKPEHLSALSNLGYVRVNRLSDGEFKLDLKGRINGGGPFTGMMLAWLVRASMYAPAATAATAVTVSTGGAAAGGFAVAGAPIAAYIATTEGVATAAGIFGWSLVWLP